ncbi:DUF362 domain-containing protein [Okeania sp.]|uniref:DUF362 domain-containing protein n=1 Tax=Okeania sp. TaxID=3100323 RepID=UPI002B4B60E3|nr:DUF362 domain-containing protein [Okeania sp.]MEB3342791.1 DUF362 domain-containing protein [Okeania sp.]
MSTVSLIKANSYKINELEKSIENLLAPLGGINAFVKRGDRVLLKPNLLTGSRPTKECVTRPEIVYCVAKMVKEAGGKPFLGDSPAFGSAMGVAKANGYLSLLKDLDLPIVEFHGKRYDIVSQEFNHLLLSKEAMAADVIINLPKLKSHVQLTMTMGVKNLFGCVPGKMKAWWHLEAGKDAHRFGKMLVETAKAINPNLTIIDSIIGHEGNGPIGGEPKNLGILGASTDVFALDRTFVEILNINPAEIPTVAVAEKMGFCSDLKMVNFPLLQPAEVVVKNWQLPTDMKPIDFGVPRIIRSTLKHLFVKFIQEPMKI